MHIGWWTCKLKLLVYKIFDLKSFHRIEATILFIDTIGYSANWRNYSGEITNQEGKAYLKLAAN